MADSKLSIEDDLPKAWATVIEQLSAQANLKLSSEKEFTVQQVMAVISSSSSESSVKSKAKDVVSKTLTCIDKFGAMIAQGTSIMFGPSAQVYNAISFLINAAKDTKEVFDNLTTLMERVGVFLERLTTYLDQRTAEEKLEVDLRRSVYRVLEHFVRIMILSYKLTRSWSDAKTGGWKGKVERMGEKVKVFVRLGAFGDDSGVKDAMVKFELLIADLSRVQIDKIHQTLSAAAKNICVVEQEVHTIHKTTQAISKTLDAKDASERIRQELNIGDKTTANVAAHNEHSNIMPSTASWLSELDPYKEWVNLTEADTTQAVLTIQGPAGYGKSYLSHAIVEKLKQLGTSGKTSELTIRTTWHYFTKDYKTVHQAVQLLIWQMSQADSAYREFLQNFVRSSGSILGLSTLDLWTRLIIAYASTRPSTEALFIVLDGLDHADEDDVSTVQDMLRTASENTSQSDLKLRFLLTGNHALINSIQSACNVTWPTVDLLPSTNTPAVNLPQAEDINTFVESRLGHLKIFKDNMSKRKEALKSRIRTELPDAARGNYNSIKRHLLAIDQAEDLLKVEKVLQQFDRPNKELIAEEIKALNQKLDDSRIKQLNEILAWVAAAQGSPSAELLRSVLRLTAGDGAIDRPADWINENCSGLLLVSKSPTQEVSFAPDAEEVLRNAPAVRETVTNEEIDLIRSMLRTTLNRAFGSDEVYDRFAFAEFFEQKRSMHRNLVHLESAPSTSLRLLRTCLQVICDSIDQKKPEYETLRTYASKYFDEHLVAAELANLDGNTNAEIGQRLYRMIHDDAVIDIWVHEEQIGTMTEWFDEDNGFCDALTALFHNQEVRNSIQAVYTDTTWLFEDKPTVTAKEEIFQHVAGRMLRRWYAKEYKYHFWPIAWLRGYYQKVNQSSTSYRKKTWQSNCTIHELRSFETWALELFGSSPEEAQWHIRMVEVYDTFADEFGGRQAERLQRAACTRCDRALATDPHKWQAKVLKAKSLFKLKDYTACMEQLESVIRDKSPGTSSEYDEEYWKTVVPLSGSCGIELCDYETAVTWYRAAVDHDLEQDKMSDETDELVCKLLTSYRRQGEHKKALDILRRLDQKETDNKSWLRAILEIPYSDLHSQMVSLAYEIEAYEAMDSYYSAVLRHPDSALASSGAQHHLEFLRARLHWYCGPKDSRHSVIHKWDRIMEQTRNADLQWSFYTQRTMLREVAKALLVDNVTPDSRQSMMQTHIDRLTVMSESEDDLFSFSLGSESKRILARILHVHVDKLRARKVLEKVIQKAIEMARDKDTSREGFELIAMTLPVLDDDINALAAWSMLDPIRESTDDDPPVDSVAALSAHELESPANSTNSSGSHADVDTDTDSGAPDAAALDGELWYYCDGDCGRRWSYADDMWVCKDCVCTQLDTPCYEKLRQGQLGVTVCHKEHNHIHVPSFDVQAWRAMDPTTVKVGEQVMRREDWLSDLERVWGSSKKESEGEHEAQESEA